LKTFRIVLLIVANIILFVLILLWIPVTSRFPSHANPAQDYAGAIARFEKLQAKDGDDVLPECHSTLLTHGEEVTQTIVFFHGISNCPAQFALLGQRFYDLGYNVLVPRLPYNGERDRMTTDLANLTAEDFVSSTDEAVDIAKGLGDRVTIVGFSTGGAQAAWAAAERADVDQTVLMSAFLSPKAYPPWLVRPLERVLLLLPNQFWWWDGTLKDKLPGPPYTYPRYASHAMAQIMRLSLSVQHLAQHGRPKTGSILAITNGGAREMVDNSVTAQLLANWQGQGMEDISIYQFNGSLNLDHDYIDPGATTQPVDVTQVIYPIVIEQIRNAGEQDP